MTIAINFIFSKGNEEDPAMYSKSNNIEIMISDEENESIKKTF